MKRNDLPDLSKPTRTLDFDKKFEKLKFQSLEKFNNKKLNSVGNENKLRNDFASLSNYFKELSKAKDKEKTQNISG